MVRIFRRGFPDPARKAGEDWTMPEAATFLGVSMDVLRRVRAAGALRVLKVAGRVVVPDAEVQRVARDGFAT